MDFLKLYMQIIWAIKNQLSDKMCYYYYALRCVYVSTTCLPLPNIKKYLHAFESFANGNNILIRKFKWNCH